MKKKTILLFLVVGIVLGSFIYAETSSSSINWASIGWVTANFEPIDSNEYFYINMESCIDDPCLVNLTKYPDDDAYIIAKQGRKFQWRTEP